MSGIEERPSPICPRCKKEYYWACNVGSHVYIWLLSDDYFNRHAEERSYFSHVQSGQNMKVSLEKLDDIEDIICKNCEAKFNSADRIFEAVKKRMAYWIEREGQS